jgi:hypothetical protein
VTDYTILSNTAVGVGGLPSGATITALRDNPIAIAEGAPGAPRLLGDAVASLANGALAILTVAASNAYRAELGAGFVGGTTNTTSAVNVVAATYTISNYTGSMRFKASHNSNGSGTIALDVFKNGVLVATWTANLAVATERTADISVVPTDVIEWRHRLVSGTTSIVTDIKLQASDAFFEVVPLMAYSAV